MSLIADIIQNNNWKSSSFEDSTDVNRLYQAGILTSASPSAKDIVNAVGEDNVQSVVTVGLVDVDWAEQNLGDASDTTVAALEAVFGEAQVKTFYGNQWWGVRTIERDLMNSNEPNRLVLNKVGSFWATQINRIMSATVSGMSDIAAITVGDGLSNLSRTMVIDARKKKGDMGFGKLANMYMNSTTLADILTKQEAGTIPELITEKYSQVTIVKDGITQLVQSDTPEYVYAGTTKVVVDDAMSDGIISMVEAGAFAHTFKDLTSPLTYSNDPKAGNGAGKEEWGTKALYIVHPIGFTFKGALGVSYASKSGLTLAELQGGGLYDLVVDPKLSMIQNLKVKIG